VCNLSVKNENIWCSYNNDNLVEFFSLHIKLQRWFAIAGSALWQHYKDHTARQIRICGPTEQISNHCTADHKWVCSAAHHRGARPVRGYSGIGYVRSPSRQPDSPTLSVPAVPCSYPVPGLSHAVTVPCPYAVSYPVRTGCRRPVCTDSGPCSQASVTESIRVAASRDSSLRKAD